VTIADPALAAEVERVRAELHRDLTDRGEPWPPSPAALLEEHGLAAGIAMVESHGESAERQGVAELRRDAIALLIGELIETGEVAAPAADAQSVLREIIAAREPVVIVAGSRRCDGLIIASGEIIPDAARPDALTITLILRSFRPVARGGLT
jgi:hypothetical protein